MCQSPAVALEQSGCAEMQGLPRALAALARRRFAVRDTMWRQISSKDKAIKLNRRRQAVTILTKMARAEATWKLGVS